MTVYECQSDFAKKYVEEGHAKGLAEGFTKRRAEGLTEGFTEGFTNGHIEGLTQGLIKRLLEGLTQGRTEEAARAVLTVCGLAALRCPMASASASSPRRTRNGWNAGWRRPPSPLPSPQSSTSQTENLRV